MTEIQRAPETTATPERGLSLHPNVKAALLLFMTTLAGCMQKSEITPAQAPAETVAAEVCYEDKSGPADYRSDKGDKYGECITSKAAPYTESKSSKSDYSDYDKRYPTCEQV